jgi:hypothetical protein
MFRCRKGPASGEKKCHALNTSEGYISGLVKHTLSIGAFADLGVRARKLGGCMIMFLLLTNCSAKFDGYDPSTAVVRWIITYDSRNR